MGARMSGGVHVGPTSQVGATRGVLAPPGLVARSCSPQTSSSSQYFSKIPEKIILDFQDVRRTFIFGVLFYRMLKQKT